MPNTILPLTEDTKNNELIEQLAKSVLAHIRNSKQKNDKKTVRILPKKDEDCKENGENISNAPDDEPDDAITNVIAIINNFYKGNFDFISDKNVDYVYEVLQAIKQLIDSAKKNGDDATKKDNELLKNIYKNAIRYFLSVSEDVNKFNNLIYGDVINNKILRASSDYFFDVLAENANILFKWFLDDNKREEFFLSEKWADCVWRNFFVEVEKKPVVPTMQPIVYDAKRSNKATPVKLVIGSFTCFTIGNSKYIAKTSGSEMSCYLLSYFINVLNNQPANSGNIDKDKPDDLKKQLREFVKKIDNIKLKIEKGQKLLSADLLFIKVIKEAVDIHKRRELQNEHNPELEEIFQGFADGYQSIVLALKKKKHSEYQIIYNRIDSKAWEKNSKKSYTNLAAVWMRSAKDKSYDVKKRLLKFEPAIIRMYAQELADKNHKLPLLDKVISDKKLSKHILSPENKPRDENLNIPIQSAALSKILVAQEKKSKDENINDNILVQSINLSKILDAVNSNYNYFIKYSVYDESIKKFCLLLNDKQQQLEKIFESSSVLAGKFLKQGVFVNIDLHKEIKNIDNGKTLQKLLLACAKTNPQNAIKVLGIIFNLYKDNVELRNQYFGELIKNVKHKEFVAAIRQNYTFFNNPYKQTIRNLKTTNDLINCIYSKKITELLPKNKVDFIVERLFSTNDENNSNEQFKEEAVSFIRKNYRGLAEGLKFSIEKYIDQSINNNKLGLVNLFSSKLGELICTNFENFSKKLKDKIFGYITKHEKLLPELISVSNSSEQLAKFTRIPLIFAITRSPECLAYFGSKCLNPNNDEKTIESNKEIVKNFRKNVEGLVIEKLPQYLALLDLLQELLTEEEVQNSVSKDEEPQNAVEIKQASNPETIPQTSSEKMQSALAEYPVLKSQIITLMGGAINLNNYPKEIDTILWYKDSIIEKTKSSDKYHQIKRNRKQALAELPSIIDTAAKLVQESARATAAPSA